MTPSEHHELDRVARIVARRYAARVWWADLDELRQEAWLAIMISARTWNPEVGVPFPAYAWQACVYALSMYLWRQSAPVSETWHRVRNLAGVHRVPLDEAIPSVEEEMEGRLDCLRRLMRLRALLHHLLNYDPDGNLAERVLLQEEKPAEVAASAGIPIRRVYSATLRFKARVVRCADLYDLWKDGP